MPCEYCPADAEECPVCRDDLDPLTPSYLFDVGYGSGTIGETRAKCVHVVQQEYQTRLSESQLSDLLRGWEEGSIEADDYRKDMTARADAPKPEEWVPDPDVPGGMIHLPSGEKCPF